MMDELRAWQKAYTRRADFTDSPVLEARLRERANMCDALWHDLEDAARTLWFF